MRENELLDWLASKIGVLIAIGVITTFVLGLFAWQHSALIDREGQGVADSISRTLESLGNVEAATILKISFGTENGQLPNTINGKTYSINITSDMVMIESGNRLWMSKLIAQVIPQNLTQRSFNLTESETMDIADNTNKHDSGQSFVVERARIDVSGNIEYKTLVYWEE